MVERDAVIFADGTTAPPLLNMQLDRGKRPDVTIVSSVGRTAGTAKINKENIDEVLGEREVYVVSAIEGYCPQYLLEKCEFEDRGLLSKAIVKSDRGQ